MEAPHPGGVGDAWDENASEGGQSEVDVDGGGRSEPEVDGGAAPLPSLLLLLPSLLSRLARQDQPCLQRAGGAEG